MIANQIHAGVVYGDGHGNAFEVREVRVDSYWNNDAKKRFVVIFRVVASVDDNLRLNQSMALSMENFLKWVTEELGTARRLCTHLPMIKEPPTEPGWYLAFIPGLTAAPLMVNLVMDGEILRPANSQFLLHGEGRLPIFWSKRIEFQLHVSADDKLVSTPPVPKPPDASEPLPPAPPSEQHDNFEPPSDETGAGPVREVSPSED